MVRKKSAERHDPYFIDYPARVAQVQKAMAAADWARGVRVDGEVLG